jgi:homoserine dehydrogenase
MPEIETLASEEIEKPRSAKEIRVGIVGYGNVGRATAGIIAQNADEIRQRTGGVSLRLTRVCRRNVSGAERTPEGALLCSDWKNVVNADDVDIVVEAIGGTDPAYSIARSSLEAGKAVVTANKVLIAECGEELFALAHEKGALIGIEATVGGGVPIVRAIAEALAGDRIEAVYGIVNGTTNFILTQMETRGLQFAEALEQAQAAGYAEADPGLDIDGFDARDKIAILARLAFNASFAPKEVPVNGIRRISATDFHYARRLNSTIRLVASAERSGSGITVSVKPWMVERDSMLAKVDGPNNAIFIAGEKVGTQMFYGHGAGGNATGTAVVSDVVQIAKQLARGHKSANGFPGFHRPEKLPLTERLRSLSWYLRLTVTDHPGILARVAQAIADQNINIDSVIQEPHMSKDRLSFVITLEPIAESVAKRAVQAINKFDFMLEPVLLLPIVSQAGHE